jgi:hypothetical protein
MELAGRTGCPDFRQRSANGLVHSHHGNTPNVRLSGRDAKRSRNNTKRGYRAPLQSRVRQLYFTASSASTR